MKVISGTFEKGCGVIVKHEGNYYHLIVLEDADKKPFVEIENKIFYEDQKDQEEKIMMTYEQFKEVVTNDFMKYIPDKYADYMLEIRPVKKINKELDSLSLKEVGKSGVYPTIYINDMYGYYMNAADFDMSYTLQYFAEMMAASMESPAISAARLNFNMAKDNIVFQLINTEQNKELLADVPHRSFLDLSIVYRWLIVPTDEETGIQTALDDETGIQTVLIRNKLADQLGLTEEQLYDLAFKNTERLLPTHIETISDVLGLDEETAQATGLCMMYTVSNKYHIYGAGAVLYEQVLYDLSKRIGGCLYVFPSSVHEWIVAPVILNGNTTDYWSNMVYEINMTLSLEERLSNQVYFYDPEKRILERITDTEYQRLDGNLS